MAEKQTHFDFSKTHQSPDHAKHSHGSSAEWQFDTFLRNPEGKIVKRLGATTADPPPDSSNSNSSS